MKACVDVGYSEDNARAACVLFRHWEDEAPVAEYVLDVAVTAAYVPGQFYRRELPALLAVLNKLAFQPEVVLIDGYVWLDDDHRKGLGAYLFEALEETVPVIGVAKTKFATVTTAVELFRGASRRPLWVTAASMDQKQAAECVKRMHGEHRIPTLLKRVDKLTRPSATRPESGVRSRESGGRTL